MAFRNYTLILFILLIFSCKTSQNSIVSNEAREFIKQCADSVNSLKPGGKVPYFVFNSCLDRQSQYWPNLHNPLPVRKLIINRVTNKEAMIYILSLQDPRLK